MLDRDVQLLVLLMSGYLSIFVGRRLLSLVHISVFFLYVAKECQMQGVFGLCANFAIPVDAVGCRREHLSEVLTHVRHTSCLGQMAVFDVDDGSEELE